MPRSAPTIPPRIWSHLLLPLALLLSAAGFLLCFSIQTQPFSDVNCGDSTVYRYLGMGLLRGRLPYVDLCDNKGPLLYLIEAVGALLGGRWGLFVLQVGCWWCTLGALYGAARLLLTDGKALIATLIAMLLMGGCLQGGNRVEEFMLPALSLSLWGLMKLVLRPAQRRRTLGLCAMLGACCGCVVLLRPNDAVGFYAGAAVGLAYHLLRERRSAELLAGAAAAAGALLCVVLPVVIWYARQGALASLWEGVVGANADRANGFAAQLRTLLSWGKWAILLLMVALWVMMRRVQPLLCRVLMPVALGQLLMLGELMYAHYFLPLLPLLLCYMVGLLRCPARGEVLLAVAILCLAHRPLPRMAVLAVPEGLAAFGEHHAADTRRAAALLQQIPSEATVWNYNLTPWDESLGLSMLQECGVVQCNRLVGGLTDHFSELDFAAIAPSYVVAQEDHFEQASPHSLLYAEVGRTQYCGHEFSLYASRAEAEESNL